MPMPAVRLVVIDCGDCEETERELERIVKGAKR